MDITEMYRNLFRIHYSSLKNQHVEIQIDSEGMTNRSQGRDKNRKKQISDKLSTPVDKDKLEAISIRKIAKQFAKES